MPFQSTVNQRFGFGVVGELLHDGPLRSTRRTLNSSGTPNLIGYAYTYDATTGIAQVGGALSATRGFAGILANPKEYVSYGTSGGGPLAPTLALPDNAEGDLVEMGTIVVNTTTACNIGDLLVYDNVTGAISTVAAGSGSAGTGKTFVPNGTARAITSAAGLIAARLTN